MIFFGLAYHFMRKALESWEAGNPSLSLITAVAVSVALGGAIMTSYVRARAEGLGLECEVGLMQRPERIVFIAFGAIFTCFHEITLVVAIFLVAIFSNITAIQRLYHVWIIEKNKNKVLISE
jgi:CDP-diacylglycerol--glycerol-3-phosphate 3-phosphatidyltransferase